MYGLLVGCWDVGGALKKWRLMNLSLQGAGFKQSKWQDKSCIHHQKKKRKKAILIRKPSYDMIKPKQGKKKIKTYARMN